MPGVGEIEGGPGHNSCVKACLKGNVRRIGRCIGLWKGGEIAGGTGLGAEAGMVWIGRHVVERRLLPSKCTRVLEFCHQANILHHGSIVRMSSTSEARTPFSTVAIVFGIMLWYLVTIGMMW